LKGLLGKREKSRKPAPHDFWRWVYFKRDSDINPVLRAKIMNKKALAKGAKLGGD